MVNLMHKCPNRGCEERIPLKQFACRRCWGLLSGPVRVTIRRTAGARGAAGLRVRGVAIRAARAEWRRRADGGTA